MAFFFPKSQNCKCKTVRFQAKTQKKNKFFCFALDFSYFGFAEVTLSRQKKE